MVNSLPLLKHNSGLAFYVWNYPDACFPISQIRVAAFACLKISLTPARLVEHVAATPHSGTARANLKAGATAQRRAGGLSRTV
jgi:hypothetical protein